MKTTKEKEVTVARPWHWTGTMANKTAKQYLWIGDDIVLYDSSGVNADYAQKIQDALNLHEAYVELEKVAVKTVKILRGRYISDYELSQALAALAALKKGGG